LLSGGAKLLCSSAVHLARRFPVVAGAAGIFLVSIGTSAPDLVSAVTAILSDQPCISVGNILGSNFANLTLGFGVAALVSPFKCSKKIAKVEFPLLLALTILFVLFCLSGGMSRRSGILFLAAFAAYLFFTFSQKRAKSECGGNEIFIRCSETWTAKKGICAFVFSTILLAFGAHFAVKSCCRMADFFAVSKTFVGFSLVAFGTSAPEIFVVTVAAKHHRHDICCWNIVGSNLINLMLVAGICATVRPIYLADINFLPEALALVCITLISCCIFRTKKIFSRACGIAFVATYLVVMFAAKG
ncbi:MAG: sodium:calcium antiporter, partial [Puniceicoccales bacterium]|nr:sodium:calcium antiporter [Puniceicoccales bacterium]